METNNNDDKQIKVDPTLLKWMHTSDCTPEKSLFEYVEDMARYWASRVIDANKQYPLMMKNEDVLPEIKEILPNTMLVINIIAKKIRTGELEIDSLLLWDEAWQMYDTLTYNIDLQLNTKYSWDEVNLQEDV